MTETFEYRGFKITAQPAILAVETMRVVATKGRKSFQGKLGDVTAEIDACLEKCIREHAITSKGSVIAVVLTQGSAQDIVDAIDADVKSKS